MEESGSACRRIKSCGSSGSAGREFVPHGLLENLCSDPPGELSLTRHHRHFRRGRGLLPRFLRLALRHAADREHSDRHPRPRPIGGLAAPHQCARRFSNDKAHFCPAFGERSARPLPPSENGRARHDSGGLFRVARPGRKHDDSHPRKRRLSGKGARRSVGCCRHHFGQKGAP